MTHVRAALAATAVFLSLLPFTGRITEDGGLGYDGVLYARMVTGGLEQGSANTRLRPLVVVVNRALHDATGASVVQTFLWANVAYFFVAAAAASALLAYGGAPPAARVLFGVNLAMCVATAQYYAFYPVQVDLGALAVITGAVYFAVAGPGWAAAVLAVAAVASREFGVVVVLFGVVRALRLHGWARAVTLYAPAAMVFVLLRLLAGRSDGGAGAVGAGDFVANAAFWLDPLFVLFFAYFTVTLFGGVSAFIVAQPRRAARLLRAEPELLAVIVPVLLVSALGNADIWRYLVFVLPAAALIFGRLMRDVRRPALALGAVTLITIATQWPWRRIDLDIYFAEWFPYYWRVEPSAMAAVWAVRGTLAAAALLAAAWAARRSAAAAPASEYHVRW